MALAKNVFRNDGIYILDEPEAALSPMKLMNLMSIIKYLSTQGAQFIISTHSPILMAIPGADVIQLTEDAISRVPYYETEHFQFMKYFINNPNGVLKYLYDIDAEN